MASEVNEKIQRAIHSLRKDSPLRQQAELVLADPSAEIDDLQPVLRAFDKWSLIRAMLNGGPQTVAVWLIKTANWPDGQRIGLANALSRPIDTAAKARKLDRRLNGVLSIIVFYICFRVTSFMIQNPFLFGVVIDIALACAAIAIAITATNRLIERIFSLRHIRLMIECLGELGQPASIVSIATALQHGPLRDAAEPALRRVIPNLRSDHHGTLTGHTVPALCEALHKADHATVLIILKALSIIGDARAIKPVERLVVKSQTAEISKAASELLPILLQRELASQSSTQLLRASDAAGNGPQELLRGVIRGSEDDPELLLRASSATAEEPR